MSETTRPKDKDQPKLQSGLDRRTLLIGGGVLAAGFIGYPLVRRWMNREESVFIARNQKYNGALARTIRDGLLATGFDPDQIRGKKVLLKPNMVEPNRSAPQMTTHPAMVAATAEVFRDWQAEVIVGEAPGHVRDTEMALSESGIVGAIRDTGARFADLNYEDVGWVENLGGASDLDGFYFPRSVLEADLIVSMPKMKTHHWVGFTASMKNLYGTIPGIVYGWPKNVLHHNGIPQTVVDINASLPKSIAIVDGIVCMEGDGPIMGSAKSMGLVLIGQNPPSVDATVARIMGLVPERVQYLALAAEHLGPIEQRQIIQQGEDWRELVDPFEILDEPYLQKLRAESGVLIMQTDLPSLEALA